MISCGWAPWHLFCSSLLLHLLTVSVVPCLLHRSLTTSPLLSGVLCYQLYGWEAFTRFYYQENVDAENGIDRKDRLSEGDGLSSTDSRTRRLSMAAGEDLTPLIEFWGIPIGSSAAHYVVSANFTVAGEISSFDSASFRSSLLSYFTKATNVIIKEVTDGTTTVAAASVSIATRIVMASRDGTVGWVDSAKSSLKSLPVHLLSSALGFTIESVLVDEIAYSSRSDLAAAMTAEDLPLGDRVRCLLRRYRDVMPADNAAYRAWFAGAHGVGTGTICVDANQRSNTACASAPLSQFTALRAASFLFSTAINATTGAVTRCVALQATARTSQRMTLKATCLRPAWRRWTEAISHQAMPCVATPRHRRA